jgi:hypothetical protein
MKKETREAGREMEDSNKQGTTTLEGAKGMGHNNFSIPITTHTLPTSGTFTLEPVPRPLLSVGTGHGHCGCYRSEWCI